MILKELCKIKSFGSNMKSSVTSEDIADKERELGFALPQALKELYLTFHPDAPAFSGKGNLIPFEEQIQSLRFCPSVGMKGTVMELEVSRYHKSKDIMSNDNLEDPQMWGFYISPETRKEEKHLGIMHPTAEQSVGA